MIHRFRGIVVQGDNSATVSNPKLRLWDQSIVLLWSFETCQNDEVYMNSLGSNSSPYTGLPRKFLSDGLSPAVDAGFKVLYFHLQATTSSLIRVYSETT